VRTSRISRARKAIDVLVVAVLTACTATLAPAAPLRSIASASGTTARVSITPAGAEGNSLSEVPELSGDGRYVAFASLASNLVTPDTNGQYDIFVKDLVSNTIVRASTPNPPGGAESNGFSFYPSISDDGRYVAFESTATNLVAGDTNGKKDVFVRDLALSVTARISVNPSGNDGTGVSSVGEISADGRYVAFHSSSSNLVAGDTNGVTDAFRRDMVTGTTSRASVRSGGTEGNQGSFAYGLSSDGALLLFSSNATNLVTGDENLREDIFLHDFRDATTTRVSVNSVGAEAAGSNVDPAMSADGRYIVFVSVATNLVSNDTNGANDVFLKDRTTGATSRLSVDTGGAQANSDSYLPQISADGSTVAFESRATNLITSDANGFTKDIFVRRLAAGVTEAVSLGISGAPANGPSIEPAISQDGSVVSFESDASNLVLGDNNTTTDVFVTDLGPAPAPTADLPIMFVHGINGSFLQPGFDGLFNPIRAATTSRVEDFHYYQDIGSRDLGTGVCTSDPLYQPLEPNGGMPVDIETADPSVCDSESDMALNAAKLHHDIQRLYFESGRRKVVLIGNSMGVTIIRGFLAYSAELNDGIAATMVDSVEFLEGAHAGVFAARAAVGVGSVATGPTRLAALWLVNVDLQRPAAHDLASESDWYDWTNPPASHLPDLPYFNVYGDMTIVQEVRGPFGLSVTVAGSVGDGPLQPGSDDPHAVPLSGGSRFLAHGQLEAQQWQWGLYKPFTFDPLLAVFGLSDPVAEIANDPIAHWNFGARIQEIQVASCEAGHASKSLADELASVVIARATETSRPCVP
jgi:Tol biopolymer transport system component